MIRLLLFALSTFNLLTYSTGFAQLADRYVHTTRIGGYVHTGYVASSSSVTVEEADFRLILSPGGSALVDLSIEKQPDTPIELRLRDATRYTLLSCRSRTDAPVFVRRLDLRELDNGSYTLDIQIGKKHLTRRLRLVSLNNTEQTVLLED